MKKQSTVAGRCLILAISASLLLTNNNSASGEGLWDQIKPSRRKWSLPSFPGRKKKSPEVPEVADVIHHDESAPSMSQDSVPWHDRRGSERETSNHIAAHAVAADSVAARALEAMGLPTKSRRREIADVPVSPLPSSVPGVSRDDVAGGTLDTALTLPASQRAATVGSGSNRAAAVVHGSPTMLGQPSTSRVSQLQVAENGVDMSLLPPGAKVVSVSDRVFNRSHGKSMKADADPGGTSSATDPLSTSPRVPDAAQAHLKVAYNLIDQDPGQSANEFLQALAAVAEARDAPGSLTVHAESLRNALGAMIEYELLADAMVDGASVTAEVITEFRTPIGVSLKHGDVTAAGAVRAYPAFIQQSFVVATGQSQLASKAYYGLARIHLTRWQRDKSRSADRQRLEMLLGTAVAVDQTNWRANNELGILYAEEGKFDNALAAFRKSILQNPTSQNWNNLAKTYQQLGEYELARAALQRSVAILENRSPPAADLSGLSRVASSQLGSSRNRAAQMATSPESVSPQAQTAGSQTTTPRTPMFESAPFASFLGRVFGTGNGTAAAADDMSTASLTDGTEKR